MKWLLVPLALLVSLGSVLTGHDRLAFRDVSHFYTPLYGYVAEQTSNLELSLWNPLCGTGMPLAGETSTAVFYPIRYLTFSLPLEVETAIGLYVFVHLWIASLSATWLAKRWGVADLFAPVAGVLYALGGSVFFLHTNPPFLVGAAWLPFALGMLLVTSKSGTVNGLWWPTSCAGLSLAMMVLGGDPQTALHAMMVVTIAKCAQCIQLRNIRCIGECWMPVVGAGLLAAALAAPQVAASIDWSRQSSRVAATENEDWIAAPASSSKRAEVYQFSLPPWHLAELATPWASGSLFPVNRRISQSIPGDGRLWTPTIFMGTLGLLALVTATIGRRRHRFGWWPCLAWVSLLLSMGHFGPIWLLQQTGMVPNVDSAIGGPYWFLYQLFPLYDSYRYPIKWLPFFAIACAIIAASWTQAASEEPTQSAFRSIKIVSIAFLMMMIVAIVLQATSWHPESATGVTDEYWGPLQWRNGLRQVSLSILQSAIVLVVVSCLLVGWPKKLLRLGNLRCWLLLVLITAELALCNLTLVAKVQRTNERELISHSWIGPTESQKFTTDTHAMRMQSAGGWPKSWSQSGEPRRIETVAAAERAACFGRWHLEHRINVLNGMTTIRSQDLDTFWRVAGRLTHGKSDAQQERRWRSLQRWLQLNTVIHVDASRTILHKEQELPRVTVRNLQARFEPDAVRHTKNYLIGQKSEERFETLIQSILAFDAAHDPYVFTTKTDRLKEQFDVTDVPVADSVTVQADGPTLIVRPVYQDGNWTATLLDETDSSTTSAEVCNVDFLKQGVIVPAGTWIVTFTYQPWWFRSTVLIALFAWALLIVSNLRAMVRTARHSPDPTATVS